MAAPVNRGTARREILARHFVNGTKQRMKNGEMIARRAFEQLIDRLHNRIKQVIDRQLTDSEGVCSAKINIGTMQFILSHNSKTPTNTILMQASICEIGNESTEMLIKALHFNQHINRYDGALGIDSNYSSIIWRGTFSMHADMDKDEDLLTMLYKITLEAFFWRADLQQLDTPPVAASLPEFGPFYRHKAKWQT
jgi:hypothetical protein